VEARKRVFVLAAARQLAGLSGAALALSVTEALAGQEGFFPGFAGFATGKRERCFRQR
jgi:hypothetical protein